MINLNLKEKWMLYALREAEKALKIDEVPIGAIIINKDKIIGRGFNQVESLNDPTAHAEILAITSAANTILALKVETPAVTSTPPLVALSPNPPVTIPVESTFWTSSWVIVPETFTLEAYKYL